MKVYFSFLVTKLREPSIWDTFNDNRPNNTEHTESNTDAPLLQSETVLVHIEGSKPKSYEKYLTYHYDDQDQEE